MEKNPPAYQPWWPFRSGHFNTIYSRVFRKTTQVSYHRERLELEDGDFLDLDFSRVGSEQLLILLHGLEGSSDSPYAHSLVHAANQAGMDAMVLNMRGCSGEPNRLLESYHSGKSDDLNRVINHLIQVSQQDLFVVGVSLGGNITLKYAGERGDQLPDRVKAVAGISVPCDLAASAVHLAKRSNFVYLRRFLKSLRHKTRLKAEQFPDSGISVEEVDATRDFHQFDNLYTAPAHGFKDAADYYQSCSSRFFIPAIQCPALIINALDDPFLPKECYPVDEAMANPQVQLLTTRYGGHVGFHTRRGQAPWFEQVVIRFFQDQGS
ncbi:alpha/beta fold hydrolase [bacterium SCSIO 12741]|nr:alpha/beta fold hydrolase [bacterium SCSIO 12741]